MNETTGAAGVFSGIAGHTQTNSRDIYDLLERLCKNFVGDKGNHREILRHVTQYVSSCPGALGSTLPYDEVTIVARIVQHLQNSSPQNNPTRIVAPGAAGLPTRAATIATTTTATTAAKATTSNDAKESCKNKAELFLNLHQQLKAAQLESHKRSALLTFLYCMAESKYSSENGYNFDKYSMAMSTTAQHTSVKYHLNIRESHLASYGASSSTNTMPFIRQHSLHKAKPLSNIVTPSINHSSLKLFGGGAICTPNLVDATDIAHKLTLSRQSSTNVTSTINCTSASADQIHQNANECSIVPASSTRELQSAIMHPSALTDAPRMLDSQNNLNDDIIQNVIYSFTGIQGKYLKKDVVSHKFKLDIKAKALTVVQAGMLLKLAELGYYHDLLLSYTDTNSGRCALGLMGQGFISALRHELTQYYGMVAMLQDQLNKQRMDEINSYANAIEKSERLTLMKVLVWSVNPLQRLQLLVRIGEACQEKKGGALASTVHKFLNNGSPIVKNIAENLLVAICGPFYQMLSKWISEGEICDPHNEFFIECLSEVGPDRLWYDKYRVRTSMLPDFVTPELANKILITGKSINFLCEVCEDKQPVKGRDELRHCIEKNPEHIFSQVADTKLHSTIDAIYMHTSKRVLDIVLGPHKLLEHLQAMRRYLLLGQGDFIGILMENLKHELNKPAKDLYSYDLSSIMDATIRSTNAQFDDPEILNHLDLRLMSPFDGDIGWDIFTLQYSVRGPLATMLEPSMPIYQMLFKPLWRMKHIEFVLSSKIWKDQKCNAKLLKLMHSELRNILYRLHLFTSEMIHFIHQMQYYILFEVIECSWAELQERVQQAKTLDDILNAHNAFLEAVRCGIFLDSKSKELCQNMDEIFEAILSFEVWQDKFYKLCFRELNARKEYAKLIKESEKLGTFGTTTAKKLERDQENKIFEQKLSSYYKSLESRGDYYEKSVRRFLLALNSNDDHNLQLFGIRLDFNEYYKKRDQRLGVPLTFEHMRMSNLNYNASNSNSKSLLPNSRTSVTKS